MSRQYQDPNYHSGQYQTTYPYPNPQQTGQYTQPSPNPRDTYNDHPGQQAFSSYPAEGSLQPQPSGRRQSSHSPYAGHVSFPEPQGSSIGHPQAYLNPSQATPHLPVGTPQQGYQSSYGYPPSTSDSQRFYAADRSDTGGGDNFYSNPETGYRVAQPLDGSVAGYENVRQQPKGRGNPPAGTHSRARPLCRYPGCGYTVFMDDRVQELREWCSDAHMQAAVANRVEKPCRTCQRWPRLNGYKYCSGDRCRFPGRY